MKLWIKRAWLELCLWLRLLRNQFLRPFGGAVGAEARLFGRLIKADGTEKDLGLLSTRVVTDAGVAFIVDAFQNTTELETMKYHAAGTSGTAENQTDTTLGTEVETRGTGTTAEGASANIYQTVGTVSFTATRSIVEHGVFSAAASGTLLDRSVFTSIGVDNGDSIQFTYELTFPANG